MNAAICGLIEEWNMVQFLPLDPNDTDTIDQILAQARCTRGLSCPYTASGAELYMRMRHIRILMSAFSFMRRR